MILFSIFIFLEILNGRSGLYAMNKHNVLYFLLYLGGEGIRLGAHLSGSMASGGGRGWWGGARFRVSRVSLSLPPPPWPAPLAVGPYRPPLFGVPGVWALGARLLFVAVVITFYLLYIVL